MTHPDLAAILALDVFDLTCEESDAVLALASRINEHWRRLLDDPAYNARCEERRVALALGRANLRLLQAGFPARLLTLACLEQIADGEGQRFAVAQCAQDCGSHLWYLHGPAGCGTTSAAICVARLLVATHPENFPSLAWITEADLLANPYSYPEGLLQASLLVLDGLGSVAHPTDALREALARLIRHRTAAGDLTLIASSLSPGEACDRYGLHAGLPLLDTEAVVIRWPDHPGHAC